MRRVFIVGLLLAALAAGCGSTKTVTVTHAVTTVKTVTTTKTVTQPAGAVPCTGADLVAIFKGIEGSAGAGNISYALVLTNTSSAPCTVSGTPVATLLDKTKGALPTQISTAPNSGPATTVVLRHGDSAKAEARFSPDVPGTGEQQTGGCEPTAYFLRVTPGGGSTVDAPINPPTPVCEHGALSFAVFTSG